MDRALLGFKREMDLGKTLARVVGIPTPKDVDDLTNSPQGSGDVDRNNEARFLFRILLHPAHDLKDFFEK